MKVYRREFHNIRNTFKYRTVITENPVHTGKCNHCDDKRQLYNIEGKGNFCNVCIPHYIDLDLAVCWDCLHYACSNCGGELDLENAYNSSGYCNNCENNNVFPPYRNCLTCNEVFSPKRSLQYYCDTHIQKCLGFECGQPIYTADKRIVFCDSCKEALEQDVCLSCNKFSLGLNKLGICEGCWGSEPEPVFNCVNCDEVEVASPSGVCAECYSKRRGDVCDYCYNNGRHDNPNMRLAPISICHSCMKDEAKIYKEYYD